MLRADRQVRLYTEALMIMMMFSTKNERLALLLSAVLFGLIGIAQLWRFFSQTSVTVGSTAIPTWISLVAGLVALAMAFWMGVLFRNRRPVI